MAGYMGYTINQIVLDDHQSVMTSDPLTHCPHSREFTKCIFHFWKGVELYGRILKNDEITFCIALYKDI